MGVLKNIVNPDTGVTANYWRCTPIASEENGTKFVKILAEGWVNHNCRNSGKNIVHRIVRKCTPEESVVRFDLGNNGENVNNPFKVAYEIMKEEDLSGGVDV